MAEFKKSLFCDSCGSNDIVMLSRNMGQCEYCGTKFIINKKENEPDGGFFTFERALEIDEFERNAYISLYSNVDVPSRIDDAMFSRAELEIAQYVSVESEHKLHYTASIGYDRTETYYDYVTVYRNGRSYKDRVARQRTVTDWDAISGDHEEEEIITCLRIDKKGDIKDEIAIADLVAEQGGKKLVGIETQNLRVKPIMPSDEQIEAALEYAEVKANAYAESSLPGDHVKDFRSSGSKKAKKIDTIVSPEYLISYNFEGRDYQMKSSWSSKAVMHSDMPRENVANSEQEMARKKRSKQLLLGIIPFALIFIIGIILAANEIFFFLPPALFLSMFGYMIYFFVMTGMWSKRINKITFDAILSSQNEKISLLNKRFLQMGQKELSEEEKGIFLP